MTSDEKNNPFSPSSIDAAYSFLQSIINFDVSKILSTILLLCASAAYTFSAMPSTVNFYRTIIPPLETLSKPNIALSQNSATADAVRKTSELINVSQVYAVPSLLLILEVISIFLSIEFWRLNSLNKSPLPVLILFCICQSYPFISVVFQIADTHRAAQLHSHEATSKSESTGITNLQEDAKLENEQLKELYKSNTDLLKLKSTAERRKAIEANNARILILVNKIDKTQEKRNTTQESVTARNSSVGDHSGIAYWLDNALSREMLIAYFLAAIFPVMLMSLGYYRVRIAPI
ncbi:hypothetical protein [Methylobacter tundripaludum]|uniref:Uncharacterized protein n=1 Tax=Methylobacter tundripaludum (strain ATCC BAA-1195 / DSM 17260 / SV96) TaxID=697282 RepID=G3ISG5_METTV|nr:hypothetical protein [Methylobacter tundripaludum]EGW22335.1 hypothetical protein Mettu_1148 [Methylobacter tundripaludum SV96]